MVRYNGEEALITEDEESYYGFSIDDISNIDSIGECKGREIDLELLREGNIVQVMSSDRGLIGIFRVKEKYSKGKVPIENSDEYNTLNSIKLEGRDSFIYMESYSDYKNPGIISNNPIDDNENPYVSGDGEIKDIEIYIVSDQYISEEVGMEEEVLHLQI
jgi:hypothetical protein